jgi:hypothetical protein
MFGDSHKLRREGVRFLRSREEKEKEEDKRLQPVYDRDNIISGAVVNF